MQKFEKQLFLEYARQMSEQLLRRILPEEKFTARG